MYEKKGRYIVEFPDIPATRQHQTEISVEDRRGNNKEVELGFDEEKARREARRCLSCRRCLGCALCWAECKPEAIIFELEDEEFQLDADSVIVRVVDDGPGIPEAIRARIFDPFFTTKQPGEGTGLGLDIVRRLVSRNKGEVDVASAPGRTEFRVTLARR